MILSEKTNLCTMKFTVSSEIFSFNTMIESCRSFLLAHGYKEMSRLYIILRELIFNTILNVVHLSKNCELTCTIDIESNGRCKVKLQPNESCRMYSCFDWIKQSNDDLLDDRVNILLNNLSESIEIDNENNSVLVECSIS